MADLKPKSNHGESKLEASSPSHEVAHEDKKIEVTKENAAVMTVFYLAKVYNRLGYIIKLLEEKGK